ncbi:AfsA-related hotdog domain-containing protein [Curtobacterium sp. 22159]|uniref:AfsA-related hotdog domain-containing protein n=1 Tax=Curtobacterium sp. 22159 TaxID=3453882 RepID=UPI003F824224
MFRGMTATATTETAPTVRFERLVAGQAVHRSNLADVLITDAQPLGQDRFLAGAHWPRNHVLLGRTETVDPALAAETIRQVTIYAAHAFYDVASDAQFLMLHITANACSRPSRQVGPQLVLEVTFTRTRRIREALAEFEVQVTCSDAVGVVASGSASGRIVSRSVYERARGTAAAAVPADDESLAGPLQVIRKDPVTGAILLVVDPDEPAFFDHPLDHVPGMLMLEAARQSALDTVAVGEVAGFDARFRSITELSGPCHLVVVDDVRGRLVRFEQGGQVTAEILCRLASPAAPQEGDAVTTG